MNAMDLWQFTPLHEAASKSRVEVCSLLLAHGADPTLVNCHSKSAIDVAPTRELQERLQQEFKGHSLLEGCRQADVARVKKYLEVVNFKHPYSGDTALVGVTIAQFNRKLHIERWYFFDTQIARIQSNNYSKIQNNNYKLVFYSTVQQLHLSQRESKLLKP